MDEPASPGKAHTNPNAEGSIMNMPRQTASLVRETVQPVDTHRAGMTYDYRLQHAGGIVPQTFGGGTYTCSCPGSSVQCPNNKNCLCDALGARCV